MRLRFKGDHAARGQPQNDERRSRRWASGLSTAMPVPAIANFGYDP